jgi:LCP family protein required for cell wall assembly
LVLVVVSLVSGFGMRALTDRYDHSVAKETLLDPSVRGDRANATGPLNYLLIGSDQRPSQPSDDARSDTIIVVHVPASMDRAYLISIPRDLLVDIPADGSYAGGNDKVNAAFQYGGGGPGGAQLLSVTLSRLTGLRFDGAALVDFSGFERVIDLVGGVRMCVDTPVRSIHTGTSFAAGCQRMTGARALDYARQRYDLPHGDYDRQRHQQQLLRAIMDRMAPSDLMSNPIKLDQVIRAVGSALTVDTNGAPLEDLVFAMRGIHSSTLVGIQLPSHPETIDEISYDLRDPDSDGLFQALRAGDLDGWVRANSRWVNQL